MSREENEINELTLLGNTGVKYPTDYAPEMLETFENKHPENEYVVTFDCPEFTSLCPKTGQPDFARIVINYIPRRRMVESKSLKLYLFSFRNHGDFHEDCVNIILKDLVRLMDPRYIEVTGIFTRAAASPSIPLPTMATATISRLWPNVASLSLPQPCRSDVDVLKIAYIHLYHTNHTFEMEKTL